MWFLQPLGSCWSQTGIFFRSVKWLSLPPGNLLTREWIWRSCVWCFCYPYRGIQFPTVSFHGTPIHLLKEKPWFLVGFSLVYCCLVSWIHPWIDISRYFPGGYGGKFQQHRLHFGWLRKSPFYNGGRPLTKRFNSSTCGIWRLLKYTQAISCH